MKRAIAGTLILGIAAVLFLGWNMFGDHSFYKEGLSSFEGLPSTASDISVYRNNNISGLFISDFQIAELDFVSFAASNRWAIQRTQGLVYVYEARAFKDGPPGGKKEINAGIFFEDRTASGSGITVAYDRANSRAYINRSMR